MSYLPNKKRYDQLSYRRCGQSGLQLPLITLGLWHNFGGKNMSNESKKRFSEPLIVALPILI